MKAKLINNKLVYPSNFMKIGDNWVSNPTKQMLVSEGFKDIEYKEVDEVTIQFKETENSIIIYIQKQQDL